MIYIVNISLLEDVEKHFNELTDEEVIALCKKDEESLNHDVYYSIEELQANFNTDEMFPSTSAYMRVIKDDSFAIAHVSRADLEDKGYDTSNVDDATMERLASKLGDAYVENGFWIDLPIMSDYLEIPKKENENEEE